MIDFILSNDRLLLTLFALALLFGFGLGIQLLRGTTGLRMYDAEQRYFQTLAAVQQETNLSTTLRPIQIILAITTLVVVGVPSLAGGLYLGKHWLGPLYYGPSGSDLWPIGASNSTKMPPDKWTEPVFLLGLMCLFIVGLSAGALFGNWLFNAEKQLWIRGTLQLLSGKRTPTWLSALIGACFVALLFLLVGLRYGMYQFRLSRY